MYIEDDDGNYLNREIHLIGLDGELIHMDNVGEIRNIPGRYIIDID